MNIETADEPLLEITSPGLDEHGRHIFQLVFHLDDSQVVWTGCDYGEAILASQVYEFYGVQVSDVVGHVR